MANFSDLVGKTLVKVENHEDELIVMTDADRAVYRLEHFQDCCESVKVQDICGDLADLLETPILIADESTSNTDPEGFPRDYPPESMTWTFYRLTTIKGSVVIRWLGESNGYYSEGVEFSEFPAPPEAP